MLTQALIHALLMRLFMCLFMHSLTVQYIRTEWHIGPLHCADCFHSRDWHNVLSSLDSWDPWNPGIPSASGRDIYLADEDKCLCRGRQVFWPARLADQQRVVASQVTQVHRLRKDTVLAGNGSVTLWTFRATLYL